MIPKSDQEWMQMALEFALQAQAANEVPVGAVIVKDNKLIATGFNQPISAYDPSAHAEIIALRAAGQTLQNYRLIDCTMYVTLEPCAMCYAALIHARIKRLVFAAKDTRLPHAFPYNHKMECEHGVLGEECAELLRSFFKDRR